MRLVKSESIAAAASALAEQVSSALRAAIAARGRATLLVPGGRTPVPFFRALRRHPLEWGRVTISLTDERCVAADHPDSNARLVGAELLAEAAVAATFVPLAMTAGMEAQGRAAGCQALSALPRPFDAVVLGMGDDGHFASLFPRSPGLDAALDDGAAPACVAMQAPSAPIDRISLNLAALAQARVLFLFITGSHKLGLIESRATRARLPVDALLAVKDPEPVVCWAP